MRVRDQTRRYLTYTLGHVSASGLRRNFGEHEAIAFAIRDGEPERAESLMRRHISSNGDRIARDLIDPPASGRAEQPAALTRRKEERGRPLSGTLSADGHQAPTRPAQT